MRLIHTTTLQLHEYHEPSIPPYAILSHTWGEEEISFRGFESREREHRSGFQKIIQTCRIAKSQGLDFTWIDTCCIDKSSSAELTEAINSMFQWYRNAEICCVHLEDLAPAAPINEMSKCRWYTRGWCLQELLAPSKSRIRFYDANWNCRGSVLSLVHLVAEGSRIPLRVLTGESPLDEYSVAKRMSWAGKRKTTRIEDAAYSLLGIFDVNMPLIYGEGKKAFRRLQEEIVKRNNDLTIFAWDTGLENVEFNNPVSLFAPSPSCFINSFEVRSFMESVHRSFSVTNAGLFIPGEKTINPTRIVRGDLGHLIVRYTLHLGTNEQDYWCNIHLRKTGPAMFYRDNTLPLTSVAHTSIGWLGPEKTIDCFIVLDPNPEKLRLLGAAFREGSIYVPHNDIFTLTYTTPRALWDHTDRVFMRRKLSAKYYPMALMMRFEMNNDPTISFVVICDYRGLPPICRVINSENSIIRGILSRWRRYENNSIDWEDLEEKLPVISSLPNYLDIVFNDTTYRVEVCLERAILPLSFEVSGYYLDLEMKSLRD